MDMIVVPALRELACVLLLGRFRVHTSDTLGLLRHHIVNSASTLRYGMPGIIILHLS